MHQLVTLIVDGTDKKAALRNAESCAQDMCEEGSDYDWYNMNGRWGESEAVRADSITGAALIKAAMDKQYETFTDNIRGVKYLLKTFTEREIYEEEFEAAKSSPEAMYLGKYHFTAVYGGAGNNCVYAPQDDVWGGPVSNEKELQRLLERQDLWVVQIDFHY